MWSAPFVFMAAFFKDYVSAPGFSGRLARLRRCTGRCFLCGLQADALLRDEAQSRVAAAGCRPAARLRPRPVIRAVRRYLLFGNLPLCPADPAAAAGRHSRARRRSRVVLSRRRCAASARGRNTACPTRPRCVRFKPDAVFVPGNWVPHFFPGVKVRVGHGFAVSGKENTFSIRGLFDIYCTLGRIRHARVQPPVGTNGALHRRRNRLAETRSVVRSGGVRPLEVRARPPCRALRLNVYTPPDERAVSDRHGPRDCLALADGAGSSRCIQSSTRRSSCDAGAIWKAIILRYVEHQGRDSISEDRRRHGLRHLLHPDGIPDAGATGRHVSQRRHRPGAAPDQCHRDQKSWNQRSNSRSFGRRSSWTPSAAIRTMPSIRSATGARASASWTRSSASSPLTAVRQYGESR